MYNCGNGNGIKKVFDTTTLYILRAGSFDFSQAEFVLVCITNVRRRCIWNIYFTKIYTFRSRNSNIFADQPNIFGTFNSIISDTKFMAMTSNKVACLKFWLRKNGTRLFGLINYNSEVVTRKQFPRPLVWHYKKKKEENRTKNNTFDFQHDVPFSYE